MDLLRPLIPKLDAGRTIGRMDRIKRQTSGEFLSVFFFDLNEAVGRSLSEMPVAELVVRFRW